MSSFLNEFFRTAQTPQAKADSKQAFKFNRWDRFDYDKMFGSTKPFRVAERQLSEKTGTAAPMLADQFYGLYRVDPQLRPKDEMRSSHMINHSVAEAASELELYEQLHDFYAGDPIGAALACVDMEPELEKLIDKLDSEQQKADNLEQLLQQYEDLQDQLEEMAGQPGAGSGSAAERIREQMEKLKQQIESGATELEQDLERLQPSIRSDVSSMLSEKLKDAQEESDATQAWGLDPGVLQRMDSTKRRALADKLKSEKFKRFAQLIGPLRKIRFSVEERKYNESHEEIYDLTTGSDLQRLVPTELAFAAHPVLKAEFIRRFNERSLIENELRGTEWLGQGGVIFVEDGSGSMRGDPEVWSKAVGVALLNIAVAQHRPFNAVHFGGTGQYKRFDFDIKPTKMSVDTVYGTRREHYEDFDALINFAESVFMSAGTCFMTALSAALDIIEEQYAESGKIKADVVFVTDGYCRVSDAWLKTFKARQKELGFKIYGVMINGNATSDPFYTICDGRVVNVQSFAGSSATNEVASIFSQL